MRPISGMPGGERASVEVLGEHGGGRTVLARNAESLDAVLAHVLRQDVLDLRAAHTDISCNSRVLRS